jgi:hypothetical protein
MNGLQYNNGELICDVDRSVSEGLNQNVQLCEVYDENAQTC